VKIHPKVLEDLEFHRVLERVAEYAYTDAAREKIKNLRPVSDPELVWHTLKQTDEYLRALQSGNLFPGHDFDPVADELAKTRVENFFLSPETLLQTAALVETAAEWKKFLKQFPGTYPAIERDFEKLHIPREVGRTVRAKIRPDQSIKDNASEQLQRIRKDLKQWRLERDRLFKEALKKYEKAGFLHEIKESFVDGRPVLAVLAGMVKHVKGEFAGTSRSGNIIFVEPAETLAANRQLARLTVEEKAEIIRILQELTEFIRPRVPDLVQLEAFFIEMDTVRAKALFARETNSVLPGIPDEPTVYLKKAYHPLLLLENRKANKITVPQDIRLTPRNRILVISGPNAGGKSITLKTVGLLQLMFQSGMLIPVAPGSELRFFQKILTDIGDNQSIENQLSTYSYRLRNMKLFLRLADENTLLLIDEFGTGSDPELGGALAEIFLEIFNNKKAYGVITTHYNNLKLLAEKLDGTVNAHMEFDMNTLSPTYRLHTGEPGSSHTFEVARKIGIPYSLIRRAQQRVDGKKVRFDRTLSDMQRKLKQLHEEKEALEKQRAELEKQMQAYRDREYQLIKKLNDFRELYESENRDLEAGKKIKELFDEYFKTQDKRRLWKKLMKWLEKEGAKHAEKPVHKPVRLKKVEKQVKREIQKEDVRQKWQEMEMARKDFTPEIGDKVRVEGSRTPAVIMDMKGDKAVLNYGRFTAEVPLLSLELIQKGNTGNSSGG